MKDFLPGIFLFFLLLAVFPLNAHQRMLILFDSSMIELKPEKINSSYSDYAPCFFPGGIIFSSNRKHSFGVKTYNAKDKNRLDDLYFSALNPDHSLQEPRFLDKINTRFHEGTSSFDSLNNHLYYASTVKVKNKLVLGIYRVKHEAGNWGVPEPVLIPTDTFSYFHPFIFNEGKSLLVASDKTGGIGGTDLYLSINKNGIWLTPENLGPSINTSKNEGYPFIDSQKNLFFSSRGHPGYGGYDIFYSQWVGKTWRKPRNIGPVINSPDDDFGLIFDLDKRFGFFSTNRFRKQDDEIMRFEIKWPVFKDCAPYEKPTYCYEFSEESSLIEGDTMGFFYEWSFGNGKKGKGITTKNCYDDPGEYLVELNIIDKTTGTLFLNQVTYAFEVEEEKVLHIKGPDTVYIGDQVLFSSDGSKIEGHVLLDYFWNNGTGYLLKGKDYIWPFTDTGLVAITLGVVAKLETDPTGPLRTFCTTKTIFVYPPDKKPPPRDLVRKVIGKIEEKGETVFNLNKVKEPEFSVYLGSSKVRIEPEKIPVDKPEEIVIQEKDSVFRYLYGSGKNLKEIVPYFQDAKRNNLKGTFVLVLSNDTIVANQLTPEKEFAIQMKEEIKDSVEIYLVNFKMNADSNKTISVVKPTLIPIELISPMDNPGKDSLYLIGYNPFTKPSDSSKTSVLLPDSSRLVLIKIEPGDKGKDSTLVITQNTVTVGKTDPDPKNTTTNKPILISNPAWGDTLILFFDFDKSYVKKRYYRQLRSIAEKYNGKSFSGFVILGFADPTGPEDYNLDLSKKRTLAVEQQLLYLGVKPGSIKKQWYGEQIPLTLAPSLQRLNTTRCVLIIPEKTSLTKEDL